MRSHQRYSPYMSELISTNMFGHFKSNVFFCYRTVANIAFCDESRVSLVL